MIIHFGDFGVLSVRPLVSGCLSAHDTANFLEKQNLTGIVVCKMVLMFVKYLFLYLFISHRTAHLHNSTVGQSSNGLIDDENTVKLLPEPTGEKSRELKFGESIKLEELGPIIINPDGTTRRITNWANLTKQEQQSTYRLISARNKRRVAELEKASNDESTAKDNTVKNTDKTTFENVGGEL